MTTPRKTSKLTLGEGKYAQVKGTIPKKALDYARAVETLISEETQLLAKYLRDERKTWIPRLLYN